MLEPHEVGSRLAETANQLVQLQLNRARVPVLAVLQQGDEDDCSDRGRRRRDQEPIPREVEERPDCEPEDHRGNQPEEGPGRADYSRRALGDQLTERAQHGPSVAVRVGGKPVAVPPSWRLEQAQRAEVQRWLYNAPNNQNEYRWSLRLPTVRQ